MKVAERIARLRALMKEQDLQAYIVPSADPHQSEYVSPTWQRRGFISGFDGSAGTVVVTADRAGLWTDSRYFLQAAAQLGGSGLELFKQGEPGVPEVEGFLAQTLRPAQRVGLDPRVFSVNGMQTLQGALSPRDIRIVEVERDLVEQVWGDKRPPMPRSGVRAHPLTYAGEDTESKLTRLRQAMVEQEADALLVAALDEVAWLLNLRGADVPFNPVTIAYALVEKERATLFIDPAKVEGVAREALGATVEVRPYEALGESLSALGAKKGRVWLDPVTVNHWVARRLENHGALLLKVGTPIPGWKARKNPHERAGMSAAHLRDGVAMVNFLCWLESTLSWSKLTERDLAEKIHALRAKDPQYIGPSFETISAYGPHGAIVHYQATAETNLPLRPEGLLLFDSGGQYVDGTTDITRTIALGKPTVDQKRAYTYVLKGHLLLTRTIFPAGTNGYQLDAIARSPLWSTLVNYGHGTGHGIGAALCVHEGPFSVSLRRNLTPLEPGHILSIEPGCYLPDRFGVRIENLACVEECETTEFGTFLGFDTLTLCPYDRNLIDKALLSEEDRIQINAYHARVGSSLSRHLDEVPRQFLEKVTQPI